MAFKNVCKTTNANKFVSGDFFVFFEKSFVLKGIRTLSKLARKLLIIFYGLETRKPKQAI